MPDYDLTVRNARIIDGTGAPAVTGAVAVAGGRIAAVGDVAGSAAREIDAGGHVVAPGFIDVHTHDDAAFIRDPAVDFKLMQGVTTCVLGNCGAGVAPANEAFRAYYQTGFAPILGATDMPWSTTAEYFAAIEAAHPACNAAAYVPMGVVRYNVIGLKKDPPTAAELDAMRALVDEAMAAGAIGMSTGLVYVPGTYAQTPEIIELAKVVAQHGGIYTSHIRNEGAGVIAAVAEAIEIGEIAGCPVQISHVKAAGVRDARLVPQVLELMAIARGRGIDVTGDVYPYTASSSGLAAMFRIARGAAFQAYPAIIASVKYEHEKYEGKYISDIAQEMDLPIEDAIRKILHDEENSPSVIMFIMEEEDVRKVVADPHIMLGSDGLPSEGKPHPRLYGSTARLIQSYVREQLVITLEDAVRKMTSLPAAKHRLRDRGVLRPGAWADIVIFDPDAVADVATYQEPRRYPSGIDYVIVNGEVAAQEGQQTAARAGRVLRRNA